MIYPPSNIDPVLSEYLVRAFAEVDKRLDNSQVKLMFSTDSPPQPGTFGRFPQAVMPQIDTPGLWYYDGKTWKKVV